MIAPGYAATPEPVQVASIATLVRRIDRHDHYDLIVTDEAHHSVAGTWRRVIDAMPRARLLGCTATPERLDGRGLGDISRDGDRADHRRTDRARLLIPLHLHGVGRGARTCRASSGRDYAVDELAGSWLPVVIGSAVASYEKLCPGKRAIVYGVDRRHSMMLAQRFIERGHKAAHLDGDTPKDERRALIAALAAGEIHVITNCGLISEGLDVPAVEAVLLARPTQSLALYLQQVGRALRPAPGKVRALILDCAGNLYRHGMPDVDRQWSLDGKPRRQREPATCRGCVTASTAAINPPKAGPAWRAAPSLETDSNRAARDRGRAAPGRASAPHRGVARHVLRQGARMGRSG